MTVQAERVSANAPASLEQEGTSELCVQPGSQGKRGRASMSASGEAGWQFPKTAQQLSQELRGEWS